MIPTGPLALSVLAFGHYAASAGINIPIFYSPTGDLGKAATNVSWGTPGQQSVTTTFDTGSRGFWVDTQNSTIVAENEISGGTACTYQVHKYYPVYNYTASKSHSPIVKSPSQDSGFSYGNSKFISSPTSLNDTMAWSNGQTLKNQRVALADNTTTQVEGGDCSGGPGYSTDVSIMGVGLGSSFRANLLASGLTKTLDWSLWFNKTGSKKTPIDEFHGNALMGSAPPSSAYSGKMVTVPLGNSEGGLFYTVNRPNLSIKGKAIPAMKGASETLLLDTGTIDDMVPFPHTAIVAADVGLVYYTSKGGFVYTAYNGTCASIPEDLTLDYTFAGTQKGQNVTVKVPVRNYATGAVPKKAKLCNLGTLQVDNAGTSVFGVPFLTAATVYFQDDAKTIGLAQGGVA